MTKKPHNKPKKICIFGGTGFIGEGVVPRLLEDGHKIFLLVRSESEISKNWKENEMITWALGDATNFATYKNALDNFKPDTLIYLIGLIREFPERGITWEKLHYQAFVDVVSILKKDLKKVIYMSADVARSEGTGYETTKWRAEEFIKKSGVDYTIFRPTIVMAPSAQYHFTQVLQGLTKSPFIPLFGSGSFMLSPVSRDDVAEAFAQALLIETLNNRTFDVKGQTNVTYRELLQKIKHLSGRIGILTPIPLIFFKVLGKVFGRFSWFPFTYDQILMLTRGIVSDNQELWTLMSHHPLPLNTILQQYRDVSPVE